MTTQTTTANQFPELLNKAFLVGEVYDHELEIKDVKVKDVPMQQIQGTVHLRTGENETHRVFIFSRSITNAGKENGIFAGYKTLHDEMITVKMIAEGKAPEGAVSTKLRVNGEMGMNEYYREGKLSSNLQIKGNFLNRLKADEAYEPQAKFDIEAIVNKKRLEIKGEDGETGRTLIELIVPAYQAPVLMEFIAPAEYADYIEENFEIGATVNVYGDIVNFSEKIVTMVEMGFGDAKPQTTYNNTRELQVRGGKVFEEENVKTYSQEQREALQAKRNTFLAEKKTDSENRDAGGNKKDGFPGMNNKAPGNGGAKPSVGSMF